MLIKWKYGEVVKVGYFFDIAISIADSEFKIKSLYSNDLILNIVSKSKGTVQKLKFLDSNSRLTPVIVIGISIYTVKIFGRTSCAMQCGKRLRQSFFSCV